MSTRILTPLESISSSISPLGSSVRSSMYEKPEHPPPLTPTRRRVWSSGNPCSLTIFLISEAAFSESRIGINELLWVRETLQTFQFKPKRPQPTRLTRFGDFVSALPDRRAWHHPKTSPAGHSTPAPVHVSTTADALHLAHPDELR